MIHHKDEWEAAKKYEEDKSAATGDIGSTVPPLHNLDEVMPSDTTIDLRGSNPEREYLVEGKQVVVWKTVLYPTAKSQSAEFDAIYRELMKTGVAPTAIEARHIINEFEAALINAATTDLLLDEVNGFEEAQDVMMKQAEGRTFVSPLNPDQAVLNKQSREEAKTAQEIEQFMLLLDEQYALHKDDTQEIRQHFADQRAFLAGLLRLGRERYLRFRDTHSGIALMSLLSQLSKEQPVDGHLTRPPTKDEGRRRAYIVSGVSHQTVSRQQVMAAVQPPCPRPKVPQSESNRQISVPQASLPNRTTAGLLPGGRPAFRQIDRSTDDGPVLLPTQSAPPQQGQAQQGQTQQAQVQQTQAQQIQAQQTQTQQTQAQPAQSQQSQVQQQRQQQNPQSQPQQQPQAMVAHPGLPQIGSAAIAPAPIDVTMAAAQNSLAPAAPAPASIPATAGVPLQPNPPPQIPIPAVDAHRFGGILGDPHIAQQALLRRQQLAEEMVSRMSVVVGPIPSINNDIQERAIQSQIAGAARNPHVAVVPPTVATMAAGGHPPQNPVAAMQQGATIAATMAQAANQPRPPPNAPLPAGVQHVPAAVQAPVPPQGHVPGHVQTAIPVPPGTAGHPPLTAQSAQPMAQPGAPVAVMPAGTVQSGAPAAPPAPVPVVPASNPMQAAAQAAMQAPVIPIDCGHQAGIQQQPAPAPVIPAQPNGAPPPIQPRVEMAPAMVNEQRAAVAASAAMRPPMIATEQERAMMIPPTAMPVGPDGRPMELPNNPIAAQQAILHQQQLRRQQQQQALNAQAARDAQQEAAQERKQQGNQTVVPRETQIVKEEEESNAQRNSTEQQNDICPQFDANMMQQPDAEQPHHRQSMSSGSVATNFSWEPSFDDVGIEWDTFLNLDG